ncbi:hypothetical protein QEN19_003797 [Hanseniaspora menglaensis]
MSTKDIENSNIAAELQPNAAESGAKIEGPEGAEVLSAILQVQEDKNNDDDAVAAAAAVMVDAAKEEDEEEEGPSRKKQKLSSKDVENNTRNESFGGEKAVQRKESHKEVERRRRETINTAINELRDLCSAHLGDGSKNGTQSTTASQMNHSKSEVLNAACNYIKDLKNKLAASEMDFENFKSVSRVEISSVTSEKDALQEALAQGKKD